MTIYLPIKTDNDYKDSIFKYISSTSGSTTKNGGRG